MTLYFLKNKTGGIFNAGSGTARTWNDLAAAVFKAMDMPVKIDYIDLPEHLAAKYQYFTKAEMDKIKKAGYNNPVSSLEEGVTDYIQNYLMKAKYLGY
jgi:ADP-L-glycero-D-manno-heptose 6-epimerase